MNNIFYLCGFGCSYLLLVVTACPVEADVNRNFLSKTDTSSSPIRRLSDINSLYTHVGALTGAEHRHRSRQVIAQVSKRVVEVTGVQLTPSAAGLEVRLRTADGKPLPAGQQTQSGNTLTVTIANAVLVLPERKPFVAENPTTGIASVSVTQQGAETVQVILEGQAAAPTAAVVEQKVGLVLSAVAPLTLEEVVVTGERQRGSAYAPLNATTATRTDTPILDIPQSIQVIPRKVLEDQQVIRLDEALRNTSGVSFGGTNLGRRLEFTIRGFDEAPILRNGFRQFGADVIPETANLDRIEVLKGPASVLYGEIEPGGLINLVTEKPISDPSYTIQTQFGNRNLFRPQVDLSGPLTADGSLLYRLNGLYQSSNDVQNVDTDIERFFISPVVTWKIGKRTDLTFELEYFDEKRAPIFGLPAIGDEIADVPLDRITNEPDDTAEEEFISIGYDLEHRFNNYWKLRNAFRFTQQNSLLEVAYPFEIDEETGTVTRFWAAQPQDGESYSLQTNAAGKFVTGWIDHEVLLDISKSLNLALAGTFGDCFSLYHRLTSNEKVGVSDDPFAEFSKHCRTDRLESTLVNDIFEKTK
jgi:iron complex outermembrane receptor protein